ncbi:hypothetical protein NDU88_003167 [Pleurodeles waltl]|uniref:Uncharacterized protein n=1 Tax=Pleurodeles waltl TaxID=8319 RepID=A0AAV7M3S2_PLEWA|nr:hypothetical protein NDU88_003167 [Pleurodeles waltl]
MPPWTRPRLWGVVPSFGVPLSRTAVVPPPSTIFCTLLCASPGPQIHSSPVRFCGQLGSRQSLYSRHEQDGNSKSPTSVCACWGPGSGPVRAHQLVLSQHRALRVIRPWSPVRWARGRDPPPRCVTPMGIPPQSWGPDSMAHPVAAVPLTFSLSAQGQSRSGPTESPGKHPLVQGVGASLPWPPKPACPSRPSFCVFQPGRRSPRRLHDRSGQFLSSAPLFQPSPLVRQPALLPLCHAVS